MKCLRIDEGLGQVLPEEYAANTCATVIGKLLATGSKLSVYNPAAAGSKAALHPEYWQRAER